MNISDALIIQKKLSLECIFIQRSHLESIASEFGDAKSYQDARRLSDEIDKEMMK